MPDRVANHVRGEASVKLASGVHMLRPSFEALVAAEEELGSLFGLVERAVDGKLLLSEIVALFWHCLNGRPENMRRDEFARELTALGLSHLTPPLKILLKQILAGNAPDEETI